MQATKERIIADRQFATERYILSTLPVLYLPLYRLDGASFLSADGIGHLCSVTGALWTPQGRYLDGSDDKIVVSLSSLPAMSSGTVLMWLSPWSTNLLYHYYLYWNDATFYWINYTDAGNNCRLFLGGQSVYQTLTVGQWSLLGVSWESNGSWYLLFNGQSTLQGTTVTVPINPAGDLILGTQPAAGYNSKINMGRVLIRTPALTPLEIQHIFLATKWRWQ